MPEATFTLVHQLKPHRPVVFDKHGNIIGRIQYPSRLGFLDELEFVNGKFVEMVDIILEGSRHQPIIIFQADPGTRYGELRSADEARGRTYYDIYSAHLLPDSYSLVVPRPYTSVNTFPLILNAVFDADLKLQDKRLYAVRPVDGYFTSQQDVTELDALKWNHRAIMRVSAPAPENARLADVPQAE